jgi:hypothetical protein
MKLSNDQQFVVDTLYEQPYGCVVTGRQWGKSTVVKRLNGPVETLVVAPNWNMGVWQKYPRWCVPNRLLDALDDCVPEVVLFDELDARAVRWLDFCIFQKIPTYVFGTPLLDGGLEYAAGLALDFGCNLYHYPAPEYANVVTHRAALSRRTQVSEIGGWFSEA